MTCSCPLATDESLNVPIGVDYGWRWPVTDGTTGQAFDLTGWTAKMQIRNRPLPDGSLRATFTTDDALTTGPDGVSLELTPELTAGWTWPQGVYDIHLWNPENEGPYFLVAGQVTTFPGVTEGTV